MAKKGDSYIFIVKETYIDWGDNPRKTNTREKIPGEVYFPIPADKAREFNVYNKTKTGAIIEYNVSTSDGFEINGKVKATGVNSGGTGEYAKNLAGSGNLKLLAPWITNMKIKTGDKIKVEWTSPTDILLTKI